MDVKLREGRPDDAQVCGRIAYDAFKAIAEEHNFPPDFPSPENAITVLSFLMAHPGFHKWSPNSTAESSAAIFRRAQSDRGIGPITVDPTAQNRAIGRRLMQAVMERTAARNSSGVRLVQAAYHPLAQPRHEAGLRFARAAERFPGCATEALGPRIRRAAGARRRPRRMPPAMYPRPRPRPHGRDARRAAAGPRRRGRTRRAITGYIFRDCILRPHRWRDQRRREGAHRRGAVNRRSGFLLPTRNNDLMRWCLNSGLRITQPMTLMTVGLYNEPVGAYLPSILY